MKIRPVGFELFHAERQTNRRTDMMKLIVAFRNFANAPKIFPSCRLLSCLCQTITGAYPMPDETSRRLLVLFL